MLIITGFVFWQWGELFKLQFKDLRAKG